MFSFVEPSIFAHHPTPSDPRSFGITPCVPRMATSTLGAGAGVGAPFNILPLHIKNLILPTMSWVNQWEWKAEEEILPNERNPVNWSTKLKHQSKTTRGASARATRDREAAQLFFFYPSGGARRPWPGVPACLPLSPTGPMMENREI